MNIHINLEIDSFIVWGPQAQIDFDPKYRDRDHDSYGLFRLWFWWLWFELEFIIGKSQWDW